MENRWLVLVVTLAISTLSVASLREERIWRPFMAFLYECFSRVGISAPVFFDEILRPSAFLWFFPFALRLGWMRWAVWMGLIGIATALASFRDWFHIGVPLLPCIAMIGRRTRPWMAIPAVGGMILAAFANLPIRISPDFFGRTAVILFPYAAILIFGTKLIPKRSAPVASAE